MSERQISLENLFFWLVRGLFHGRNNLSEPLRSTVAGCSSGLCAPFDKEFFLAATTKLHDLGQAHVG